MALQLPSANDRKRVKVYELKQNDWFDRGTGLCTGQFVNVSTTSQSRETMSLAMRIHQTASCSEWLTCATQEEPRLYVESEDHPERMLLDMQVSRKDSYQKQTGHYAGAPSIDGS